MLQLSMQVTESTHIRKPLAEVIANITDFTKWRIWSPWLCLEPSALVHISGQAGQTDHKQVWRGERIGEGEITLLDYSKADTVHKAHFELSIHKPWSSKSRVTFTCESKDDQSCKVTWHMDGHIPVFLFFLRSFFSKLIGYDYKRGLAMLKEYCETSTVTSKTAIKDEVDRPAFRYIALTLETPVDDIGINMTKAAASIQRLASKAPLPEPKETLTFYYAWKFSKGLCRFGLAYAYPVDQQLPDLNTLREALGEKTAFAIDTGSLPAHRALHVEHVGDYMHLGNAWSAAMGYKRHEKRKSLRGFVDYEIYHDDMATTPKADLRASIYLPVKG